MAEGKDTPDLPRGLIDRRGTPLGKAARLPSIRGPRDLTLGGIPKKIFTPNIPVRKPVEPKEEKEKTETNQAEQGGAKPKVTKDVQSKPKKEKSSDRGQGKGRNRGQDIIQSHSIFEQGPSGKNVTKNSNRDTESVGGRFHSKSSASSSTSTTTTRVLKNEMKEDTKEVIDFLLRDDFINDRHKRDKYMEPVNLPLSKLNMKLEEKPVEIKADPDGDVEMAETPKLISTPVIPADTVLEVLTKSEESELLFFQFPDCMPGVPSNRNVTDDEEKEEEASPQTQMLSDFSEGAVGKLVIRKSGRAQLVMGNITMDVSMGTKCGFLQDVVSIDTHDNGGDLSVLGHIKHRLVCIPDFDNMLDT